MRFVLSIVKRSILFVVFCLGAIILLEGSLRVAFINRSADVPFVTEKEVSDFVLQGHSAVSLRPGLSKGNTWYANKDGFLGPELEVSSDYRIMVYGDEMIHGGHLDYEDTITPVLSKKVDGAYKGSIEVVNAGVPGIGPDQVLERLKRDVDTYRPQAIVVMVNTHNDYGDIIRNRRFYLDANNRLKTTSYTIEGLKSDSAFLSRYRFQSFFIEMMKDRGAIKVRDSFESASYDMTPTLLEERLEEEMENYQLERAPVTSVFDDVYDLDIAVNPRSSASLIKLSLMQSVLREIYGVCKTEEIEVVFVLLPSATDLLVEPVIDYKDLKASYESYMRVNLTRPLTLYMQRNKFPVINLFPGFYKHGAKALYSSENPLLLSSEGVEYVSNSVMTSFLSHKLK